MQPRAIGSKITESHRSAIPGKQILLKHFREQIAAIYQHAYPEDTKVIDPVLQMKNHLGRGRSPEDRGFLPLVQRMAARSPVQGNPSIVMQTMSYRDDQHSLTVSLTARSLEELNDFAQHMSGGDLTTKVQSVAKDSEGVRGQMAIQEAGQ